MATALIDAMTTEWEPAKYKDQYQTALHAVDRREGAKADPGSQADRAASSA